MTTIFNCADCRKAIKKNSREHDNCWTDMELGNDLWYCDDCKCDHMPNDDDYDEEESEEEDIAADHQALKLQTNEQVEVITRQMAEIEALKKELTLTKALVALTGRGLNFDDANLKLYWSAENGEVTFWKVPVDLHDRALSAFEYERFGPEWGALSSHSVRTMTAELLEEHDGEGDEENDDEEN